jgi:hypothetical protein
MKCITVSTPLWEWWFAGGDQRAVISGIGRSSGAFWRPLAMTSRHTAAALTTPRCMAATQGQAGAGCLAWSLRRVVTTYLAPERLPGAAWSMATRRPGRQIGLRAPAAASSATVDQNAVDTAVL